MRSYDSERLQRFVRLSEWPLAILALAVIPALLLDEPSRGLQFHRASEILNWIVWLAFCGEVAVKAWLSGNAREFFSVLNAHDLKRDTSSRMNASDAANSTHGNGGEKSTAKDAIVFPSFAANS